MRRIARLSMLLAFALPALLPACPPAVAQVFQTKKLAVRVEIVATGLDHPWGMAMLPDGTMLVSERRGRLLAIKDGKASEVSGVPNVEATFQGGLLDLAADEDFAATRKLYFTYSEPGLRGASTALGSATLSAGNSQLENVRRLFVMAKQTRANLHFGGRVALAPDGKLFVTTGDRGEMDRAQDFFDHAGAVIRLNRDGSVPKDNPFADGVKGLPELWSKGHRNVQGAVWDKARGMLWTVEHGAMGGDEVNIPLSGRNYGWPVIAYGVNYNGAKLGIGNAAPGYEQPVYYWDPSIAPSGMTVYDGALFKAWKGDLLVAALKFQLLVRLEVKDGKIVAEERMLEGHFGRIRDVETFADGAVYLLTDEDDGQLLKITPVE